MNVTPAAVAVLSAESIVELSTTKGRKIGTLREVLAWQRTMQASGAAIETADGAYSDIDDLGTSVEKVLAFLISEQHEDRIADVALLADVVKAAAAEAVAFRGEPGLTSSSIDDLTRDLGLPSWHPVVSDVMKTLGVPEL